MRFYINYGISHIVN